MGERGNREDKRERGNGSECVAEVAAALGSPLVVVTMLEGGAKDGCDRRRAQHNKYSEGLALIALVSYVGP